MTIMLEFKQMLNFFLISLNLQCLRFTQISLPYFIYKERQHYFFIWFFFHKYVSEYIFCYKGTTFKNPEVLILCVINDDDVAEENTEVITF